MIPGKSLTVARWLFLIYVVILPVVRPLNFRVLMIHVLAIDVVFLACFLFWLFSLRGRRPGFDTKFVWAAGAFLSALILSAFFSLEPLKSAVKLAGVIYLIFAAIVTADLVQDLGFARRVIFAWLIGTVVALLGASAGLVGFFAGFDGPATNFFLFHHGTLPVGQYPRVMSFFDNANMMANYLNVSIMMAVAAGYLGWIRSRTTLLFCTSIFAATVLTISAGIGGLVLSLGSWAASILFEADRKKRRVLLILTGSIAFLAFLSTAISPVTRENQYTVTIPVIGTRIEPSVRFILWKDSIERGLEYPILGRGTGTDAADLRYEVISGWKQWLRDAHQAWLNVFGQAGLIGLAAFIGLCWYLFSLCRFRHSDDSERSVLLVACSFAFLGAFLYQNLFGSFEDARHLWVLIGLLVGFAKSAKN